jgi:hypothetical protein
VAHHHKCLAPGVAAVWKVRALVPIDEKRIDGTATTRIQSSGMEKLSARLRVLVIARFMMLALALLHPECGAADAEAEFIRVSKDARHFVFAGSGSDFKPWGFNYDHDASNRLLETYWIKEWNAVAGDFEEMKELGANTVRIHLQVSRFMKSAREPNRKSLEQLARLLALAEKTGLYLDITGLGCYDKKDVPKWYNKLGEEQRWEAQARFWEAVAETCRSSPAVFCYDLMNEPVLSEDKKNHDWTPGAFGDRYFVQRLTLDFQGRSPKQIAQTWVDKLVSAIRKHDQRHLVTVGAIPWALTWPTAQPLFYSQEVSKNLDFVSLHFYPKNSEVAKALEALSVYDIGKPIVIEEMFPLNCSIAELDQFIDGSRPIAAGWIGFYWGKTIAEYTREERSIADALTLEWLEYFVRKTPDVQGPRPVQPGERKPDR